LQRAVVVVVVVTTVVLFYFCGRDITQEQTVYTKKKTVGYIMQISASLLSLKFLTEKQLQNHYFNL